MARLAKAEIEQRLLKGEKLGWKESNGKTGAIALETPKQRRLLAYLLASKVREAKGLTEEFTKGLSAAFTAPEDPATAAVAAVSPTGAGNGPWKIHALRTEGFGGVNAWKGAPFELNLQGESLLVEGPNGSGKSSLIAAILWALSGERPRDQNDASPEEAKPVFGSSNDKAGDWPPVATYPADLLDLLLGPNVSAEVIFSNPAGTLASVKRTLDSKGMSVSIDPSLQIPPILVEAGLLMPARLQKLRFDEKRGRLSDAVQTLTGLDELVDLGVFVQSLCHGAREYLTYKSGDLANAKAEFERHIKASRVSLAPVGLTVPYFDPSSTDDPAGEMAKLGKELTDKASDLTKVVSGDLAPSLDLADPQIQKQVGLALAAAESDLDLGLDGLPTWKTLRAISKSVGQSLRTALSAKVSAATTSLSAAISYHENAQADSRYRLKAAAARWHAENGHGEEIDQCPVCRQTLQKMPELQEELAALESAGEAATRRLSDNVNAIMAELESALPQEMRRYLSDAVPGQPRASLAADLKKQFIDADRYTKYLTRFGSLVAAALVKAPTSELAKAAAVTEANPETLAVLERISKIEMLCALASWIEAEGPAWEMWWRQLAGAKEPSSTSSSAEGEHLFSHIQRLGKAHGDAEPFRLVAEAMRAAWKHGAIASKIEKELNQRKTIVEALTPLKNLGNLAEAQARDALNDLSARIAQIHASTYLSEALKFQSATLEKKTGLVVRGELAGDIRIDATLIANTSWIRGVLWAFLFALREEAIEQIGNDPFPVLVLDDPQQTFDSEHRHRWAEHIARLQKLSPEVQVVLATHDEQFLSFLEIDGVRGRRALIASAGSELGHIGVFEGDDLDRRWQRVQAEKTPKAAQDYMAAVRVFVEGMLKLMLRGEDVGISGSLIGSCREKLSVLHAAKLEPWARKAFDTLANLVGKGVPEIKFIEMAHHAAGAHLGMTEATDVQRYWTKPLRPALERAFRIAREHRALHGGLTALHAMLATVSRPSGYKNAIAGVPFPLIGSAAALSGGRVADGCVNLQIDGAIKETISLSDHAVYRLLSPTLQPVARPGDLLLVAEHTLPNAKSLVVACSEERILARRLEIADNHSDVAVFTANAINPRMIAPPVVAKLSTVTMHKIVGVVYDHGKFALGKHGDSEICDCGGEANVKAAFTAMQGLVEVNGHSAEPHALDGQYLLVGSPLSPAAARAHLEGRPVIAEDSLGGRFFKRLRDGGPDHIVLESLEIGGDFGPIILADKPGVATYAAMVWPVLGVLFERPK